MQVCVDTDPGNLRNIVKPCGIGTEQFRRGQGGPIAVTEVATFNMQPHREFFDRMVILT